MSLRFILITLSLSSSLSLCCLLFLFSPCIHASKKTHEAHTPTTPFSSGASRTRSPISPQEGAVLAESAQSSSKLLSLPEIEVDIKAQEIHINAEVCLQSGLLEYVACRPGTFEHEALLVTRAKPEILHTALLLIGLTPYPLRSMSWFTDHNKHSNAQLQIQIEWSVDNQKLRLDFHKLLSRRGNHSNRAPDRTPSPIMQQKPISDSWVFSGSFFQSRNGNDFYGANTGGVIVSIVPLSSSVIQYGQQTQNPYQSEHFGFAVNDKLCPPVGTHVTLIISPRYRNVDQQ